MTKLFAELKRRNVFRVAGVYAVVGWLLIQIAVAVLPTFGAPQWIARTVIGVIFLGFPLALILAWAFEMTPEGMKRTSAVAEGESIADTTGKRLDMILAAAAILLVAVIIGDRLIPSGNSSKSGALAEASIAVLPFADMSPEKDQEYFADGISEEPLNVLAQVPGLEVAGRTSSFAFKDKDTDLRDIGQILNVAHVLEGSVRKSGNKVRVTAQLVRADNGFHMWSETYDGDLTDIFAVQDEIANAILAELKPQLLGEVAPLAATRTDISAYDFYLIAQHKAALTTLAGYQESAKALDQALAIDPDYVPALSWRGYYELMMSDAEGATGDIPAEAASRRADEWISKALELDGGSADALFAKAGLLSFSFDAKQRAQAGAYYERALEAKPNFAAARNDYGFWLNQQGRFAEAVGQLEMALAHDPAEAAVNTNLIVYHWRRGEFDMAREITDRWSAISPESTLPTHFYALFQETSGNLAEAMKLRRKADQMEPGDPWALRELGLAEIGLGEFAAALRSEDPYIRYRALTMLGRKDEALTLVRQKLADRPEYPELQSDYLLLHHLTGDWAEVLRYYDETWGNPAAFGEKFPAPPYTAVLPAMQVSRHPDTMAMLNAWRTHIDAFRASAVQTTTLDIDEAAWHQANGEPGKAIDLLERAYAKGARDMSLLIDPAFGDTLRVTALRTKIGNAINAERGMLGLKPIEMPKPYP